MLKIFVAGGFNEENPRKKSEQMEFAGLLGKQIVDQGHTLLSACLTDFDKAVAESVYEITKQLGEDPLKRIISYVLAGQEPIHTFGNIRQSQLQNWELGSPRLRVPEPIQLADAVILIGGFEGTYKAANWARIAKKPLLPITRFGGTAEQIYGEELDDFESRYSQYITKSDYENLTQLTTPLLDFSRTIVALAEMARTSRSVFVIMSFSDDPALDDALDTFKAVCNEFKYECNRVDESNSSGRILPAILKRIIGCAFTIVDLSVQSPNVYYELGYAEGAGKPIIVTAKKGTILPFDAKDIPVSFWENQSGLKSMLRQKVKEIAEMQGR